MFNRNRKALPQVASISRNGWNDAITSITWTDGAYVYTDSRNFMVESAWGTPMTPDHWTQVWAMTTRNAVIEPR